LKNTKSLNNFAWKYLSFLLCYNEREHIKEFREKTFSQSFYVNNYKSGIGISKKIILLKAYGEKKKIAKKTLDFIQQLNEIIEPYEAKGMKITLRQLYYQCVSKCLIKNNKTQYSHLGEIVNNARFAGLLDWNVIEDRTRCVRVNSHWNNPQEIINAAAEREFEVVAFVGIGAHRLSDRAFRVVHQNFLPRLAVAGEEECGKIIVAAVLEAFRRGRRGHGLAPCFLKMIHLHLD